MDFFFYIFFIDYFFVFRTQNNSNERTEKFSDEQLGLCMAM